MTIVDWLWCKWHGICTEHRRYKQFTLCPGGGYSYCPDCQEISHARYAERVKRLGVKA